MPRPLRFAFLSVILLLVACSSKDMASPYPGIDYEPVGASQYPVDKDTPSARLTRSITYSRPSSSTQTATLSVEEAGGSLLDGAESPTITAVTTTSAAPSQAPEPTSLTVTPEAGEETKVSPPPHGTQQVIGYSFENRPIISYQFGQGPYKVVFVGGIHGGYEWNTIMLAYQAIDYFLAHPIAIPEYVTLIIIPSANPDGQFKVTGKEGRFEYGDLAPDTTAGRFNGRSVDLNRNWACNWKPSAFWRDQPVSGGTNPFSEPESKALRDYFLEQQPSSVIFWHSSADGVYGAGCSELFQHTRELAEVYGTASGYPVTDQFTHYDISGDAGDWLSIQGIPSLTVELASHDLIEWPENLAGMLAVLEYYDRPGREFLKPE
ncbi:MAG: M14 family metallopeptidase [Candidatus Promineifilaceae bacterium]